MACPRVRISLILGTIMSKGSPYGKSMAKELQFTP